MPKEAVFVLDLGFLREGEQGHQAQSDRGAQVITNIMAPGSLIIKGLGCRV